MIAYLSDSGNDATPVVVLHGRGKAGWGDVNCRECIYYVSYVSDHGGKSWCKLNKREIDATCPACEDFRTDLDELLSVEYMPFGFPLFEDEALDDG